MNLALPPSLTSLLLGLLLLTQLLSCRADCSDDDRIPCTTCSKKTNGNGVHIDFSEKMKEDDIVEKLYGSSARKPLYQLGGVYYDEKQKLTVSLLANENVSDNDNGFKRINTTAFKELLLDTFGLSVLLSQVKPKKAERILRKAERKANKQARKNREPPPTSEMIDADIRRTILGDQKLMKKIKIAFVPANFSFEDLYDDYERLVPEVLKSGDVSLMDLDEENNQIFISALTEEGLRHAEQVIEKLQINKEKITMRVEEKGSFELDQGGLLQDYRRPIGGGLFIEVPKPAKWQSGCSIGFVAKRNQTGEVGFITASHCTRDEAVLDGQLAYQDTIYNLPPPVESLIGIETSDTIVQADTGLTCSDSAFFTFEEGVGYVPRIYKTEGNGNNVIKTSNPRFWSSIRIDTNSLVNEVVYKVGRNTGQTRGKVKRTCVEADTGSVYNRFCQDIVNTYDEDIRFQWKGDSGAATIWTLSANSNFAWIRGISYGRTGNLGNCVTWYVNAFGEEIPIVDPACYNILAEDKPPIFWDHFVSPISNVECDHGKLLVFYSDFWTYDGSGSADYDVDGCDA